MNEEQFKIGQVLRVSGTNRVFRVKGLTRPLGAESDWPVSKSGLASNPEFCVEYKGALSVFNEDDL